MALAWLKAHTCCEVCGLSDKESRQIFNRCLIVDHNYKTNQVRGRLCHNCNLALGNAHDDPVRLRKLANYLEKYQ